MECVAPPLVSIRDFIPESDSEWLHALWHRTMHSRWALSKKALLSIVSNAALLLVAERDGLQSGICAIDSEQGSIAGLILLLVEPAKQRCGIGTSLMHEVERRLRGRSVHRLTLGAGDGDYFWPGLPQEQVEALHFFRAFGFVEHEASADLIQDLTHFRTPEWVLSRLADSGTTLCLAESARTEEIAAFEQEYFPAWSAFFENEMRHGCHCNILLAQGPDGKVRGTTLLKREAVIPWIDIHGTQVGTLNTLGVAPESQGQGIGLALTAGAMEHLKNAGCSHCLIQWTGLNEWYGKLGAKPWAQYRMLFKSL